MDLLSLITISILLGGIIVTLKNGFNQMIKGLESINERLKRLEENND